MSETTIKWIAGVGGGVASFLFGGWSYLLWVLLFFVVVDYVTGWVAAKQAGELSSNVGFVGGFRKLMIFVFVAIGNMLDTALGDTLGGFFDGGHGFRDGVTLYYLANELLSITENAGRLGVPIPEPIRRAVKVLSEKGEDENGENHRG